MIESWKYCEPADGASASRKQEDRGKLVAWSKVIDALSNRMIAMKVMIASESRD
jgi:hypothetical protein